MAKRIPYQLTIKQRRGYLYVEYGGTGLTVQAILDMINIAAQAAKTLDATEVLLVRNIPLITSDADRGMFASLIKRVASSQIRFAMVDKFGNDPAESERGLNVLRAFGWNVTEFETIKSAEEWLRRDR
jgi:hypothetical protein